MTTRLGHCARDLLCIALMAMAIGAMISPPARAAPYADMVIDARTGEVLHATNADTRLHPASLTKMMTLYVAFDAIKRGEISLDTQVTVSRNAANEVPSKLGLRAGQKIALRYLIRASAVRSTNDAATAIAEAISGSEAAFADRMTRTARALGMNNTTFKNAHGLTAAGHQSTARDMTTMGRRLFYDHPEYYNLFSRRSTDAGVATVRNTNRRFLDAYPGADGIKTGFTNAAGFSLVGSAERGEKRIIATILGGTSTPQRNARMAELLDIGFRKAPTRAPLRVAAAPDLTAVAAGGPGIAAGKTIRLVTAVPKSPRPQPRPGPATPPEDMLIALKDDIESVLAHVYDEAAAGIIPAAEAATPPEEMQTGEADAGGGGDSSSANETMRLAHSSPETTQARQASTMPQGARAAPPPRPAGLATTGNGTDDAADPPMIAAADTMETVQSSQETALALSADGPEAPPPPDAATAQDIVLASPAPATVIPPPARPEGLVEALAEAAPEPRIVTRMSTSGGRFWGINLGRYPSRFDAERILLQTALSEPRSLDNSLRKVVQRSGGFDAQFAGLSREQADLACRRLQARDILCFTVSP